MGKEDVSREDLTKEQKIRVYGRCKYRGFHMLNLRGEDLKKFISECMETELKEGKQKRLTVEQRLKRVKKLVTKFKRREHKPKKRKIVYVNVTPSKSDSILQDFFVHVENLQPSKKEELRQFMKRGKVDYRTLMAKILEIEQDE